MSIYIMTRTRNFDYHFIGMQKPNAWWRQYSQFSANENGTILVEREGDSFKIYISGIPSSRKDIAGRQIRFTLAIDEDKNNLKLKLHNIKLLILKSMDSFLGNENHNNELSQIFDSIFLENDLENRTKREVHHENKSKTIIASLFKPIEIEERFLEILNRLNRNGIENKYLTFSSALQEIFDDKTALSKVLFLNLIDKTRAQSIADQHENTTCRVFFLNGKLIDVTGNPQEKLCEHLQDSPLPDSVISPKEPCNEEKKKLASGIKLALLITLLIFLSLMIFTMLFKTTQVNDKLPIKEGNEYNDYISISNTCFKHYNLPHRNSHYFIMLSNYTNQFSMCD